MTRTARAARTALISLLVPLFLAACAGPGGLPGARTWDGRFSLTYPSPSGEGAASGNFRLVSQGDALNLRLSTPVGITIAEITYDGSGARVEAGGQTSSAPTLEEAVSRAAGFALPVSEMRSWLDGVPDPASSFAASSEKGAFTQAGWTVSPSRFKENGPELIRAENPKEGVRVRLLVKNRS